MKIVQINAICNGSTGNICTAISNKLTEKGIENYLFFSHGNGARNTDIKFGCEFYYKVQALKNRILGNNGFNSHLSTLLLIHKLKKISPDIVHLHNIHSNDINLELLFSYLKKNDINVVWTFHDCWAFTGYCMHFAMAGCTKYKQRCGDCPLYRNYSWISDKSRHLQERKMASVIDAKMNIVAPSEWMKKTIEESDLKAFPVTVINNGIALDRFKPETSKIREKFGLKNKYIVLGVAFRWESRKGLDTFIRLSKILDDRYCVVLVGTNSAIDKRLPQNIVSIHRTSNQKELAELYTTADVFFNPSKEETFATVNIEAMACGCPVVTFDACGSAEMLSPETGIVVKDNSVESAFEAIVEVCEGAKFKNREIISAHAKKYDKTDRFDDYIELYKTISMNT